MNDFLPRPGQQQVLGYTGGKMGISAVPGSGKTRTLSELAAILVAQRIAAGQEVLIVTLVNSAVGHIKSQVNASIRKRKLLAGFGYRVRTLHGLAHDIVRERPGLVGLAEDFTIIDEKQAEGILDDCVDMWLHAHPDAADAYLDEEAVGNAGGWIRSKRWPGLVRDLAGAFVRRAKDLQLTPESLLERTRGITELNPENGLGLTFAQMGADIYARYQHSLAYRGAVDFDDLVHLAIQAMQRDDDYLERLRRRWPYVLEDEAQDSSRLQERLLRLLTLKSGNWVRVGDPNQAIYQTFTTADPGLLASFVDHEPGVVSRELRESGRSQRAIIDLANYLIAWTRGDHPTPSVRGALRQACIHPVPPGDLQQNPPYNPTAIALVSEGFSPERELRVVANSISRWLAEQASSEPEKRQTCAVLVPRNQRGMEMADLLSKRGIPHVELLQSTGATRTAAEALERVLQCLADPASNRTLSLALEAWQRNVPAQAARSGALSKAVRALARCARVETYLWPVASDDWLQQVRSELEGDAHDLLVEFRGAACRWHRAAVLPIDQLILTLASELFQQRSDLALAHKLALLLREASVAHPGYRLADLVQELSAISHNQRRFLGFAVEDTNYQPAAGEITVSTVHKAKGLEWDRVYLLSVNNYDYPSGSELDTYIAEPWFVRGRLNLQAEALGQLEALAQQAIETPERPQPEAWPMPVEAQATQQARLDYIAERLRLLYVGITRARRELIVTWNKGRQQAGRAPLQRSAPFTALLTHWEGRSDE